MAMPSATSNLPQAVIDAVNEIKNLPKDKIESEKQYIAGLDSHPESYSKKDLEQYAMEQFRKHAGASQTITPDALNTLVSTIQQTMGIKDGQSR